jgi:hypothetical protein
MHVILIAGEPPRLLRFWSNVQRAQAGQPTCRKEVIHMPVYKITFEVEAETVLAAVTTLKNEPDWLKYVVSVFQVKDKEPQPNGWSNSFKAQLLGSGKK